MGDYDPFSDVELKSAFIELMKSMEDKISSACEQSGGKAGKNAKNTPQKNNVSLDLSAVLTVRQRKWKGGLWIRLRTCTLCMLALATRLVLLLTTRFMAFVCSLDYQPGEKKLLPVQMDKFGDADLARVDELLIRIIRYARTL